jgi:lipopolysaccharide transport system ATP-binding protein
MSGSARLEAPAIGVLDHGHLSVCEFARRLGDESLLIVSQNPDQIRAYCDEVLVMEEGRILMQGDPESDGDDRITDHIFSGSPLTVELEYLRTNTVSDMACTLGVFNENNTKCFEAYVSSIRETFDQLPKRGSIRCRLAELPLLPGRYYINMGLFPTDWSFVYDHHNGMHFLHIINVSEMPVNVSGIVMVRPHWTVRPQDPS